jgi:uroporphyrinogen-III synthase
LKAELAPEDEVLLPQAQGGRPELHDALLAHGVRVTRVAAYQSVGQRLEPDALRALEEAPPQAVLFASPRTAEAFLEATGELGGALLRTARVVAIGPTTAKAIEALGFPVAATAAGPTPEGLLEATVKALGRD